MTEIRHASGYVVRFDEPGERSRAEVERSLLRVVRSCDWQLDRVARGRRPISDRPHLEKDRREWQRILDAVRGLSSTYPDAVEP